MLLCCHAQISGGEASNDRTIVTDQPLPNPVLENRGPDPAPRSALQAALWRRALDDFSGNGCGGAGDARHRARTFPRRVLARHLAVAAAASAAPRRCSRWRQSRSGRRCRLSRCACPPPLTGCVGSIRGSGRPHRPATAIADELAITSKDPHSLALWNAHVERALQAARTLKAGMPSPRVALARSLRAARARSDRL